MLHVRILEDVQVLEFVSVISPFLGSHAVYVQLVAMDSGHAIENVRPTHLVRVTVAVPEQVIVYVMQDGREMTALFVLPIISIHTRVLVYVRQDGAVTGTVVVQDLVFVVV
jgi:hypothetical protein